MNQPTFKIGHIPIYGKALFAPMDGISDQPFREICREFGSAAVYTEFINTNDVLQNNPYLNLRLAFQNNERPIGFQIYGDNSKDILKAAEILLTHSPDFFDLNLGCSERHVVARGAGSGLLLYPDKVKLILNDLVSNIRIPITVKIRLGYEKTKPNYLEIAKISEDCGVSAVTVHGRFRDQKWREPAQWQPILEVKNSLSIPVIGNGDIKTRDDIERMMNETNCDGVMIGRGAIGNPWIFSLREKKDLSKTEIKNQIIYHWEKTSLFYGRTKALIIFKKHLKQYLNAPQFQGIDLINLLQTEDPLALLDDLGN